MQWDAVLIRNLAGMFEGSCTRNFGIGVILFCAANGVREQT